MENNTLEINITTGEQQLTALDEKQLILLAEMSVIAKEQDEKFITAKENEAAEAETRAAQRAALLNKLGITEDEARLLLGGN